jgi:hypothetical protein
MLAVLPYVALVTEFFNFLALFASLAVNRMCSWRLKKGSKDMHSAALRQKGKRPE